MNNSKLIIVVLLTLILLPMLGFSAEKTTEPEAPLVSKVVLLDSLADMKKGGVLLKHNKHAQEYKLDCTECHHLFDSTEAEKPQPCIECHGLTETKVIEGIRAPLAKISTMKNIFHDMCKNCHDKLQRGGKPFPKKCSVCHPLRIE